MDMFPSNSTTAGVVMNLVETTTTTTQDAQMMATTTTTANSRMMSFNLLHHPPSSSSSSSSHLPLSFGASPSPIHNPLSKTTCTVGGAGDRAISHHHHLRSAETLISSLPPHRGDHRAHHLSEAPARRSHLDLWASDVGEKGGTINNSHSKISSSCCCKINNNNDNPSCGCSNSINVNNISNGNLSVGGMRMKKVKARRKVREPRFCFKTMSEVDVLDDGYKWRKYGQKVVKNTQHPRSYYRCTQENCRVKKRIERLAEDPRMVITTYEGRHVHSPSHDDDESQPSSKVTLF